MKKVYLPINYVISERLKMQTVKDNLYRIFKMNLNSINDLNKYTNQVKSFKDEEKRSLAFHLGGPVNMYRTVKYLNNLTKQANNEQ